ncbi:cysteine desulfurase family protein [Parapedobacter koreensis]|nr:cysteine desulfurase family protein [Parapedobacter koreensis]
MTNEYIYLDNNATTPLDPRVLEAMMPYLTDLYGNASSSHRMGARIKRAVDEARGQVGDLIDANPEDIIFTAGATEAINLAIRGVVRQVGVESPHIITAATEHPAVLDTCRYLEHTGVEVTYLGVDRGGYIDLQELEDAFQENTVLVCIMTVNNETGVIQDIGRIQPIVHARGALFMTDVTQALGKYGIRAEAADLMAFSAHKFYGPKGIGGLYVNPRLRLQPLIFGGGHERGLRSGTLNTSGIIGMGAAAKYAAKERTKDIVEIEWLRDHLEHSLLEIDDTSVNGGSLRLPTTTNICFHGVDNEALLLNLKNICVSNGSACHSFTMEPSHVLLAMGLTKEEANSSIRFSIGRFNTEEEISYTIQQVRNSVDRLRTIRV